MSLRLININNACELMNVSRQLFNKFRAKKDFPVPVHDNYYYQDAIEDWLKKKSANKQETKNTSKNHSGFEALSEKLNISANI